MKGLTDKLRAALLNGAVLTEKEARTLGFYVVRGAYVRHSPNDRSDRWYIGAYGQPRDTTGPGYETRRRALAVLSERLLLIILEESRS